MIEQLPDPIAALELVLERQPVMAAQVVAGSPETGVATLGSFAESTYGVWEMTPGAMSDVEADELFIVLAGEATVYFLDNEQTISLTTGSTMRLEAGARTIWTVTETLRKIYVT